MKKLVSCLAITLALYALPVTAQATALMPDFATAPTGWTTDRYQPDSFGNVGTYQGRSNVLGIGISSNQATANRPSAYAGSFYNTQGMQYAVTGGAGSILSADLYVASSWRDASNGNVRTDMWGVMTDGTAVSDYPIVGFTNYGGTSTFRIWDQDIAGGWVNLAAPVNYGAWNSLSIDFTGSSYVYAINGATVYTDSTIDGSTGVQAVIMEAYNFGDPSLAGANPVNYTANWSNTQPVPEPGTLMLLGAGLLGLSVCCKRRKSA